jgi:hypothetical protein
MSSLRSPDVKRLAYLPFEKSPETGLSYYIFLQFYKINVKTS